MRWICVRVLTLPSDGLTTIPVLGWLREGSLIVGLNSEMRVYNQWNLSTKIASQLLINTAKNDASTTTHHAK
jgi:hypothetical protein